MSELAEIVDQSDLKFINHLIEVAEIGGLKYKRPDKKIEGFFTNLRELTSSSEDISKDDLIKKCLLTTADNLKIKKIEKAKYDEKKLIKLIFLRYRAKVRLKLRNLSPKQRKKLGNKTEKWIKDEGINLSISGNDLLLELKNGIVTGSTLFTSSAFGLNIINRIIGLNTIRPIIIAANIFRLTPLIWLNLFFGITIGGYKYFLLQKETKIVVTIIISLIQKYYNKQEEEYLEKERQKLEREVGSLEDISQLMDDLKKFIENKDKTVEEVKDNLWFKRIQHHMEKKNVYVR